MTVLLADIGGTNLRFALADSDGVQTGSVWRAKVKSFESIYDAVAVYLEKQSANIDAACFVVAAPVVGMDLPIELTNHAWSFKKSALEDAVKAPCYILNDWQAVGYALLEAPKSAFQSLTPHLKAHAGMKFACGPGTGLGCCLFEGSKVWPSEAAAMPVVGVDSEITGLADDFDHLVTGPGMAEIYKALSGKAENSGYIMKAAQKGEREALKTLEVFNDAFAVFLQMIALTTCPQGGIYIGGFMPSLGKLLDKKRFMMRFTQSKKHQEMLESIPLYLFEIDDAGLKGANAFLKTVNIFD